MPEQVSKIAIIGAGAVGATIAYAAMIRGVAKQLALYDINRAKVDAEVLDLNHGLQFVPMATLEGSDDIGVCAGADVVVITAGAKQKPGQTRMELAGANVALCRSLVPQLMKVAPDALLLVVTNPVDVLTYVVQQLSGLPARRVLGSGTVLDSSRFRFLLARHLNVAVQNVHAFIAGEHGDSELPLWSSASVGGVPLMQWSVHGRAPLLEQDRARIFDDVRNAAYHVIRGKGATNYAIGLATAQILEAVLHNEQRVLPVSSRLEGYLGIRDVCLSVPSIINRGGVEAVLELPLSEHEREGLKHSADTIRQAIRTLGF
ncbi:L-lactate dehydrogenase [Stigmatella sp. ncwal1]|uniref:L-lactate dehydrogenase n=1 Tax=Stigmatella ashevillensis TaxID=2995309 RepID=A0ABT5D4U1_9BACT|nr:L-lactate dehydrogenase [Stigmatella ashevillena]MDC0708689.1 L-lactate dehydrogenase [Stigmatella ashevillena]